MRTSGIATIKRIDELIVKNDERLAYLENVAPHVPRSEGPRHGIAALSGDCDPSCPACAQWRRIVRHGRRIIKLQDAAFREIARSRLKQDPQIPTAVRQDKKANRQKWLADQIEKSGFSKEDIDGSRNDRRPILNQYLKKYSVTADTFSKDLKALGYDPR